MNYLVFLPTPLERWDATDFLLENVVNITGIRPLSSQRNLFSSTGVVCAPMGPACFTPEQCLRKQFNHVIYHQQVFYSQSPLDFARRVLEKAAKSLALRSHHFAQCQSSISCENIFSSTGVYSLGTCLLYPNTMLEKATQSRARSHHETRCEVFLTGLFS